MLAAQIGLRAQITAQEAQKQQSQIPDWKRKLLEKKSAKEQPALSVALASMEADQLSRQTGNDVTPVSWKVDIKPRKK